MKKFLWRAAIATGTIGIIAGGAAAFSAFEAHVVNVTATIENATQVTGDPITMGNVFPEEVLHNPITISLSNSFTNSNENTRATNVDYVIKQKPKCIGNTQSTNGLYAQVTDVTGVEGGPVTYVCPTGYQEMPLLCPYLSKTSPNSAPTGTDVSILPFHGTTSTSTWDESVSAANEAVGHLSNDQTAPTATTWDIDLHTPCFTGECSQDWPSFVNGANPSADPTTYEADPSLQGQQMGCDLWFEVYNIGTSASTTPPGPTVLPPT